MNIHDNAIPLSVVAKGIAKIRSLPESLVTEISDYIDYLVWKHESKDLSAWLQSTERETASEWRLSDYSWWNSR
jgi:hypothetical protein